MRIKFSSLLTVVTICLSACLGDYDFHVVTLFVKDGDRETQRREAVGKLYEHYQNSTKDRETYEVVSVKNGEFILNFTPFLNLLTICGDPEYGWSRQYQNFDETALKILVDKKITIDDLQGSGPRSSEVDSMLTSRKYIYSVNTNGKLR